MSARTLIDSRGTLASTTRLASGIDAYGGESRTYSASISSLTAFVQPANASEGVRYGRENTRFAGVAYVYAGQDIVDTDRLIVGSSTYEIVSVRTPDLRSATDSNAYTVLLLELTEP